ncbi:hypothetical protein V2J09_005384 [Rumex salicifolius]
MDSDSDDQSDISDSEIEEYMLKPYKGLEQGKYQVQKPNGTYRCPFCAGKKKQDYVYKDLMQHSSGVAKGSASRSAKQKANHLALARYMETYLSSGLSLVKKPVEHAPAPQSVTQGELYCWPWMGIIMNVRRYRKGPVSAEHLKKEFYWYKPVDVELFDSVEKHYTQGVIIFDKGWTGFHNAKEFERAFEGNRHGKKEWIEKRENPGSDLYGWFARADDYETEDYLGNYLRNNGELKSLDDIVREEKQNNHNIVGSLAYKIDTKLEDLDELQLKVKLQNLSLKKMVEDKDRMQQAFLEETRKIQRRSRGKFRRIMTEQEKLRHDLELKRSQNDVRNNSLKLASQEQEKADGNVKRLVLQQQREKEKALKRVIQLEKQLDAKQKLEMEIEELKGKLEVTKYMGEADDEAVKKKVEDMTSELQEKVEKMEDMELLNQILIKKELESNDELVNARKVLIEGLIDLISSTRAIIGIKRMGEIDEKAFICPCKQRFGAEWGSKVAELSSLWQDHLKDPMWHPFKVITLNGRSEENIDEEDEKLKRLKEEWGDVIYNAVVVAFKELNEYNPSGRSARETEYLKLKRIIYNKGHGYIILVS